MEACARRLVTVGGSGSVVVVIGKDTNINCPEN